MNSIDQNQSEENRRDLRGPAAVETIREIATAAENCFFCTAGATGESGGVRPMNVRQVDDDGNIWFLSANDSHKNQEVVADPTVRLYFQRSTHAGFLSLSGRATVSTDRVKIAELWQPILRTWFTEGVDDPRITVIKFEPADGFYWDTKHGSLVAGIKMVIGAAIGKTMDDGVQGKLDV